MADQQRQLLERLAAALENCALQEAAKAESADWRDHPAYVWEGDAARAQSRIDAPALGQLRAIDRQKQAVCDNIERHAKGYAAHDILLWGARGMGKSALLRAAVSTVQADDPARIALVQIAPDALGSLPRLFRNLSPIERQFVIFIDDLGFGESDTMSPHLLRSWLDGGVEARPSNCRLAVTANRRAIVARSAGEQTGEADKDGLSARDVIDDKLALADRFGLSLGFHPCSQQEYLEIVGAYAVPLGLEFSEEEALKWAAGRGQRSGRTAWQFVIEIAGRSGKRLG